MRYYCSLNPDPLRPPESLVQYVLLSLESEAPNEYIEDSDAEPDARTESGLPEWFNEERFARCDVIPCMERCY